MLHVCPYICACLCLWVHVHMCAGVCQSQKSTSGVVTQKPSTLLRKGLLLVPGACRLEWACRLVRPDNLLDSSSSTGNQTQLLMVTWPLFTDLTMTSALSVLWRDIFFLLFHKLSCLRYFTIFQILLICIHYVWWCFWYLCLFSSFIKFSRFFSKQQSKLIF